MAQTVCRKRFYDWIRYFDTDIELVDGIEAIFSRDLPEDENLPMSSSLRAEKGKYPLLDKRKNTNNSRSIVGGHLKYTVYSSYMKELYEEFTMYISEIVTVSANNGVDPNRFIGEHRFQVSASDLLSLGDWDSVIEFVSQNLFRALENERSTKRLIDQIDNKLGLNIEGQAKYDAMPYLDIRHILVHDDAKIGPEFVQKYPDFEYSTTPKGRLKLNLSFCRDASIKVKALVDEIDQKIIGLGLYKNSDLY